MNTELGIGPQAKPVLLAAVIGLDLGSKLHPLKSIGT